MTVLAAVPVQQRYSSATVLRARELREAEWPLRRICDHIERETGFRPSLNTVAIWVDEEMHRRHLERNRKRHRLESRAGAGQEGRLGQTQHSRDYQEARARRLVSLGVPVPSAARVMAFDYPAGEWTYGRLRGLIKKTAA